MGALGLAPKLLLEASERPFQGAAGSKALCRGHARTRGRKLRRGCSYGASLLSQSGVCSPAQASPSHGLESPEGASEKDLGLVSTVPVSRLPGSLGS